MMKFYSVEIARNPRCAACGAVGSAKTILSATV